MTGVSFRGSRSLLVEATSRYMRHGAPNLSAAMAFYALTSLAPLLVIAVSIAGMFLGKETAQAQMVAEVKTLTGPEVAGLVDQLTKANWFEGSGLLAGGLSLGFFLFASTAAMEHLRDSLNRIWEIPAGKTSLFFSLVRGRLVSLGLVLATGLVLLASLVLRASVSTLDYLLEGWLPFDSGLFRTAELSTSWIGLTMMFALLFRFIPDTRTPWRPVLVGAVVTGSLFLAGELLIGLYLGHVGVGSPYGAVGSIVVLLTWIYYSSLVFLWGAEFTCVYALRSQGAEEGGAQFPAPKPGKPG